MDSATEKLIREKQATTGIWQRRYRLSKSRLLDVYTISGGSPTARADRLWFGRVVEEARPQFDFTSKLFESGVLEDLVQWSELAGMRCFEFHEGDLCDLVQHIEAFQEYG